MNESKRDTDLTDFSRLLENFNVMLTMNSFNDQRKKSPSRFLSLGEHVPLGDFQTTSGFNDNFTGAT